MTMMWICTVIVVVTVLGVTRATRVQLVDGGFENFVLAINKGVPYSPEIIHRLQVILENASDRLHEATGLHVRSATILVPSTWDRVRTWEKSTQLTFDSADLRVDKPHPYYKNMPYTLPTWECGQMQEYIHITPEFLKPDNKYPNEDVLIANQIATYRWGVFEPIIKDKEIDGEITLTQDKVCGGRSAMEVLRQNPDYQHTGKPRTKLTFTVAYNDNDAIKEAEAKTCGRPVVLVLDNSGSMASHDRLLRQLQATVKFVKEILPFGSQIGVVVFAETTRAHVSPMITLSSEADKTRVVNALASLPNVWGATCIGQGLKDGLQMLNKTMYAESRIVLTSDGEENRSPRIQDVLSTILDSEVKVHSIAVGEKSSATLGELSAKTGGILGKYTESMDSASLNQVVSNLWSDFNMLCVEDKPLEVVNRAVVLDKSRPSKEESFHIDSSIKDAQMKFLAKNSDFKVTVTSPDKKTTYDKNSPEFREERLTHEMTFTFKDMETGEWTSTISSDKLSSGSASKEQVIMNVKATPKDDRDTYEVRTWLSDIIVKIPNVLRIYADVTKGYSPVVKAKVMATVEVPNQGTEIVELKDDGKWPDVQSLDGIYTGEFVRLGESGSTGIERYAVDISITPIEGATSVVKERIAGDDDVGDGCPYNIDISEKNIKLKPAEPFVRKGNPGAFEVKGVSPGTDQYPPSRVVDLKVTGVVDRRISLEWTAPGGDCTSGTAAEYEFRFWFNAAGLRASFSDTPILNVGQKIQGRLIPKSSGSREVMNFKLPGDWPLQFIYVGMVSRDEAKHQSDISNIVRADLPQLDMVIEPHHIFVSVYTAVYFVTRIIESAR